MFSFIQYFVIAEKEIKKKLLQPFFFFHLHMQSNHIQIPTGCNILRHR